MGLFINNGDHPDVFKNNGDIIEPNQEVAKVDYYSEMVKEQKKANETLQQSFHDLKMLLTQQEYSHANEWNVVSTQLMELKESNLQHDTFEKYVVDQLQDKNIQVQEILEQESLYKKEWMDQINGVSQMYQETISKLVKSESENEQLALKMNEQLDLQMDMSKQMSMQTDNQSEIFKRLDNQEALTEKVVRQIDHIRSILFERTVYLAEKIENGYQLTSSYVYKLMTGSDQSLTLFKMNKKHEGVQEKEQQRP
ncbi:hypothetical protein [Bacillus sp. FSL K6-3431]|uniref:hypothetical protein n=1 Tax=Bacillus sp. FSL K6-3431 TaxID=2921500 RepID=UPI0030F87F7C